MPTKAAAGPDLHTLLGARRHEILREILDRVTSIADPREVPDPTYADRLAEAVAVALDYAIEAIDRGDELAPPPPVLLAQARFAASVGIGLDAVLLRYFAGYTVLTEALVRHAEATRGPAAGADFARTGAAIFERLVTAVTEEYVKETAEAPDTADRRRLECVDALLAGDSVDPSHLAYDLDGWHLSAVASGPGSEPALRGLLADLDRRLLLVRNGTGAVRLWLGGRRELPSIDLAEIASALPGDVAFAIGEPGFGLSGWRLSHKQAAAALPVALRGQDHVVRYSDVSLLASALRDEVLVESVAQIYLDPLKRGRDGGKTARQTLGAYFRADRNVSSAAALLQVSRNTVDSRLRAVESAIGRPLSSCAAELEVALRVDSLRDA